VLFWLRALLARLLREPVHLALLLATLRDWQLALAATQADSGC
jgi:hypothetical protein